MDRTHLTQLGRALARLGIEYIGAHSPQARGRGERLNRTLQDRLVNELRHSGITTVDAANAYLVEHFIPDYNATLTRAPADPTSAFVPFGDVDLEQIVCEEEERVVGDDNVVRFDGVALQLAKQPGRPTCARAGARAPPPRPRRHPHHLARPPVPRRLRCRRPGARPSRRPCRASCVAAALDLLASLAPGRAPRTTHYGHHPSAARPSLAGGAYRVTGQIMCQAQGPDRLLVKTRADS